MSSATDITYDPLTRADAARCAELESQLFDRDDPWPAEGVHLDVPRAAVFTGVLIASSFTMHAADRAQRR